MTTAGDVLDVLAAIDRGEVRLRMTTPHAADGGFGTMTPEYEAENGWKFCVFDDCGGWDYLEWVETPDGQRIAWPDRWPDGDAAYTHPLWPVFMQFRPENEAAWHWAQRGVSPSGYRA